jgi:hypothetical protein
MLEDGLMSNSFVDAAARAADLARATFLAAWPKSGPSHEITRLVEEGYEKGESCEMAFSVAFADPAQAPAAVSSLRAAGYGVDAGEASRGFVTAQTGIQLRRFGLAASIARLERAVAPFGGFVAVIGPTRPPRNGSRAPRVRGESRTGEGPALA